MPQLPTNNIITLTTDFGTSDYYVGSMKGIILSIFPQATIVDITHEIPPHNIFTGGIMFLNAFHNFPDGTIHVVVVDPGVGSRRQAIMAMGRQYWYIGPDNGVMSLAMKMDRAEQIRVIRNDLYRGPLRSATFHGRDVFAPMAAWLLNKIRFETVGPPARNVVQLKIPPPVVTETEIHGEILCFDHFGNAITNIRRYTLLRFERKTGKRLIEMVMPGRETLPLISHYQEIPELEGGALVGSSNFVEIAVNGDSALDHFALDEEDPVVLR